MPLSLPEFLPRIEGERRSQSAPWANIYSAPEAMREGSGKGVQWLGGFSSSSGVFWFQGPETLFSLLREKDLWNRPLWNLIGLQALWVRQPFLLEVLCHVSHDSLCWVPSSPRSALNILLYFPLPWFQCGFSLLQNPYLAWLWDLVGLELTSLWWLFLSLCGGN